MKTTYRWLKEYLRFDCSPQDVVDRLTMLGHEVDGIVDLGMLDNPVRIAQIIETAPHPDGEKLTLCKVDYGADAPAHVVCGAPNATPGLKTVLALPGARLPGGMTLERTRIRGQVSEGMLLAPDEMGLGADHEGIIELPEKAPVGEGYDLLIELDVTPNRSDCLSTLGLARDLAASWGRKVFPQPARFRETYQNAHDLARIDIFCPDACPRYTARIIENVRIGPSPAWLSQRLLAVGLRPINNVVDITNYVMMELGHPMHAFDYDLLSEHRIVVRMADPGESIRLIDETELKLEQGLDMVIADADKPVALAGIMGGSQSEVSPQTKTILLESACFDPVTIRRSGRRHRLSTDASYRFERGADQLVVTAALDRASALLVELASGEVAKGVLDAHPKPLEEHPLMLRPERCCEVLGIEMTKTRVADLISALGFEVLRSEADVLVINAPSHRLDVTREEDLFEEIARLHGYNNVPSTLPRMSAKSSRPKATVRLRRGIQNFLAGLGYFETVQLSFASPGELEALGLAIDNAPQVRNPLSIEQSRLRTDLAPAMLLTLQRNQNHGNNDLRLFEVARVFPADAPDQRPDEQEALVMALSGSRRLPGWRGGGRESEQWDFFDLKGDLEALFEYLGISGVQWSPDAASPFLHPGCSAAIEIGGRLVGWVGEVHPAIREKGRFELRGRPVLAEINIESLREHVDDSRAYRELPRFPAVERDLALVVDRKLPAARVETAIRDQAGDLLESLFLFDHYEGEQIDRDKKSLGYRLVYRAPDRTLKDEEVDAVQTGVLDRLSSEFGAALRS